jgi:OOP family OmpA-OmpF porin
MKFKTLLVIALSTASTLASAQWYGGISAGTSSIQLKDSDVAVTGGTTSSIQKNETGTGFKLLAGYQFNPNFALEGGYVNLGKANATNSVTGPTGSLRGDISADGWTAMAVGMLPATERLSLLGKIGTLYSTTKGEYSPTGAMVIVGPTSASKSEFNLAYGLGLQYDISKTVSIRGELDSYADLRISDAGNKRTVNLLSVGVVSRF